MPTVRYNGVTLPYCHTTAFSQVAVPDPTGNTDWYIEQFDITVQTILTADLLPLLFPQLVGKTDNAADILMVVRSVLLEPRRAFSVTCNGQEMIPTTAPSGPGTVDAQNGPVPVSCDLMELTDTTFLMTWKVKACYWENNQLTLDGAEKVLNQPGNPVLYNRWSETQELNDCLFTTKTREGKFVIRSDNGEGFIVDKFRDRMAILGVPPGWLRIASTYKVDPSGLGLEYRHTDVEQFKMPPVPAYKAHGNYTESTLRYGAQRWGEIHLRLDGSKNTSQSEMMQVAMGICSAKLRANGVQVAQLGLGGPGAEQNRKIGILEYMHVKIGMYENFVEITMRARMKQSKVLNGAKNNNPAKVWGYDADAFTFTPGSEELRDTSAMYPSRGTAGVNGKSLLLQAAAYYDPSLRNTRIDPKTGQLDAPNQLEVGQAGQKLEP